MRLYRNVDGTIPVWAKWMGELAFPTGRVAGKEKRHRNQVGEPAVIPGSKTHVLSRLGLKFAR